MAKIVSLYSDVVTANVPSDLLSPKAVVLSSITESQSQAVSLGRSVVTLNWALPTENENSGGEHLGTATGTAQVLEANYDPVAAGYSLYEASAIGVTTSTTLTAAVAKGSKLIVVTAATGISVGSWLELNSLSLKEYFEVAAIDGLNISLATRVQTSGGFAVATLVNVVDYMTLKTLTTDFTINLSTAVVTIVAGRFIIDNEVVLKYATTLQDLGHLEVYRVPGDTPIADPTYATVIGHASVVTIDAALAATATSVIDTTADTDNGETWTYYVFAADDETTPNVSYSDEVMVETVPSIPQTPSKSVGDAQIIVSWDALPGASDVNTNGWNLYRCDGSSFIAANAKKINSVLLTSPTFDDSEGNVTNRVSAVAVPLPVNGSSYTYKIESEDTATSWATGTQNTSSGMTQNLIAEKTA